MNLDLEKSILVQPQKWRLIIPTISDDVMPVKNIARLEWSLENYHTHNNRELLIVLSGNVYMGVRGNIYPCSPGDIFYFDCNDSHDDTYPDKSPDLDHIWIKFIKGAIFVYYASVRNGKWFTVRRFDVDLSTKRIPDLSKPFDKLWVGFENYSDDLKKFKLFTAIAQIVDFVIEQFNNPKPKKDIEKLHQSVIERMCEHIDDCAGSGINLDDLARIAGYSKFHFHRLFEAHSGVTLHDYVNQARKKRVDEMLQEGCSKKEISYELGFSCPAAFSRWFKNHYHHI